MKNEKIIKCVFKSMSTCVIVCIVLVLNIFLFKIIKFVFKGMSTCDRPHLSTYFFLK